MKKVLVALLALMLIASSTLAACTIFAVGKDASVDGTTMISHTCDSTSDDLRVWLIPSMEAGTQRDIVLNGRAGADYSQFPEVKDYGPGAMVLANYTFEEDSHQYIHGMYSFMNDAGLAMGESTCSYDRNSEQGQKLRNVWDRYEGIMDCYMLQDLALETCSTAREAVEFMGSMIDQYGWNGAAECINITDGNETWVLEAYGGNIWVAVRVPDDAVFVAANRARINHIDFEDSENYLYHEGIVDFAIENGLWDGEGDFIPCKIFAPNPTRTYSTRREWVAMMSLDPSLNLDPYETTPDENWPLFVVPQEKVQIASVDASLPESVRCLAYFGWGAPDSTYLTPIWASQNELPDHFGQGLRTEPYNEDSGWWVASLVQQTATINYQDAIQTIHAERDGKMAAQYVSTKAIQQAAARLVEEGKEDLAIDLLTTYSCAQAESWHEEWKDLADQLISTYMHGNRNMKSPSVPEWWKAAVQAGDAAIKNL